MAASIVSKGLAEGFLGAEQIRHQTLGWFEVLVSHNAHGLEVVFDAKEVGLPSRCGAIGIHGARFTWGLRCKRVSTSQMATKVADSAGDLNLSALM